MRAVVIAAPGKIDLTTLDDPAPGSDDVVVEVAAVGLCGTDLHILDGEHGTLPVVPGHEMTGTVVAVGSAAAGLSVGDPVAVDPSLPCRACRYCRRGRFNLCESLGALGVTEAGAAAEFLRAPARNCVVLPDHVDLAGAALIEPLSCVVRAFDILQSTPGAAVLIYGAGTMGLLLLELAKTNDAASVHLIDIDADRLEPARAFGCSGAATAADEFDPVHEWDVVIDATGNATAIADGLGRVAPGGTFLQFGVAAPDATVAVAPYDIYRREITITGSMAILDSFERAARLFAAGVVDWRRFVTRQEPLERYGDALAAFRRGEGLKTQVRPNH